MPETTNKTLQDTFGQIYSEDVWNGGSGPGSRPISTVQYRAFLENFIYDNDIQSLTDFGCGDWQSSRFMDWGKMAYTGLDVVEPVILSNRSKFGTDNIKFELFESVERLPGGDLLVCKEVLQHLPAHLIRSYVDVFVTKYKFILITNSLAPGDINREIEIGDYRPLRLDLSPFNFVGAFIFSYFPWKQEPFQAWRNSVFLMLGTVI